MGVGFGVCVGFGVGIVGVAAQGTYNLNEIHNTGLAEIVALCDVDASRAAPIRQRFPRARFYEDYRRMMEQKDIHAVLVAMLVVAVLTRWVAGGAVFFWPAFPIFWAVLSLVVHARVRRYGPPRRRFWPPA